MISWTNHYSPKYEKCYLRMTFFNTLSKSDKTQPRTFDTILDVFENREVASCTSSSTSDTSSVGCSVKERVQSLGDCRACWQFINEHMTN